MDTAPGLETPNMHNPTGGGQLNHRPASRMRYGATPISTDQRQGGIFQQISKDQFFQPQSCELGDENKWVLEDIAGGSVH